MVSSVFFLSACTLPPDSGYGNRNDEYWYFDYNSKTCKTFIFYGYGGNENIFYTKDDCEYLCGSYKPQVDGNWFNIL